MFSVGQTVWFEAYGEIYSAEIEGIVDDTFKLKWDIGGTSYCPFNMADNKLFLTKEDLLSMVSERENDRKEAYKNNINSIQDLLQFAVDHDVSNQGEFWDDTPQRAFVEKAKELGFELKVGEE